MSKSKYLFEPKEDARSLPDERQGRRSTHVAAAAALVYREGNTEEAANELMAELCSPHTLALDLTTDRPLLSVFGLLSEFASRYPTVTVLPPPPEAPPASVSLHALYFAAGTAVHHTARADVPITLSLHAPEDGAAAIVISASRPSLNKEEAAEVLGLSGERLALLTSLGERGGFTLSLEIGDTSCLRLSVEASRKGRGRVLALSDPSLLSAFFLPLSYFRI